MEHIRVSIVVPAYNAEKWIEHAVSYLKAQTYRDFETIFVDDHSTDSTPQLLRSIAQEDSRFRFIQHTENRGCAAARNTGIEAAVGEYVICLDVDDRYAPDLLETMVFALDKYEADVAICSSVIVDQRTGKSRQFGQWRRLNEAFKEEIVVLTQPASQLEICNWIDYVAWSKMFRKDYFRKNNLWFPELRYYEDIPFSFLCCLLAEKTVFIRKPLIEYRIFGQNSMTSWTIPKQHYMVDAFYHVFRRRRDLKWMQIKTGFFIRALENIAAVWARDDTIQEDKLWLLRAAATRLLPDWDVNNSLRQECLSDTCRDFLRAADVVSSNTALMLHGDCVGLCNLSDPLLPERAEELSTLKDRLRQLFLTPQNTEDLSAGAPSEGNDDPEKRCKWLMEFYQNSDIKYIFDVSGGDLANENLQLLDYKLIKNQTATLVGYSDITCILNAIYAKTGKASILYRINNLYKDHSGLQLLRFQRTFFEGKKDLFIFPYIFLRGTSMAGILLGGNIRSLLKMAGTEYWPNMNGKVLFLESLESSTKTARAQIAQLKQLHVFEQVSGVILGCFGMNEPDRLTNIDNIFMALLPNDLPVAKTKEVGHGYLSRAIWIGKEIRLRI